MDIAGAFVFTQDGQEFRIPDDMLNDLLAYITLGQPQGSFLEAVISNDLAEAVRCADHRNVGQLPAYVFFLHNQAPVMCWGSAQKYRDWIAKKAVERELQKGNA